MEKNTVDRKIKNYVTTGREHMFYYLEHQGFIGFHRNISIWYWKVKIKATWKLESDQVVKLHVECLIKNPFQGKPMCLWNQAHRLSIEMPNPAKQRRKN